MRRIRVIPTLLLNSSGGLVKTIRFDKRTYIGDPINAVKIFNDKGVDELLLMDIDATKDGREPNYQLVEEIASEAFMPVGYGGGISRVDQMARLLGCGLEKVVICTSAHTQPDLIRTASERFGSQSVVVCLDVKKTWFGKYQLRTQLRNATMTLKPTEFARAVFIQGAGELIVNTIDRDGTFQGYDIALLQSISSVVEIPVIGCGGAGGIDDFRVAVQAGGCSGVAAGSMFVYQGSNRGILISYPDTSELERNLYSKLSSQNDAV